MRQVNIYTATTFKGLNVQNGIIGYILELVTDTEPITLDSTELLYDMKPNRAELTESPYVANAFNAGWPDKWKQNNYKTAKGGDVANADEWIKLDELLAGHKYEFRLQEEHSYRNWLKGHIEKVKEYEDV